KANPTAKRTPRNAARFFSTAWISGGRDDGSPAGGEAGGLVLDMVVLLVAPLAPCSGESGATSYSPLPSGERGGKRSAPLARLEHLDGQEQEQDCHRRREQEHP